MGKSTFLEELEEIPDFESCIEDEAVKYTLDRLGTLQINVGKQCNLACKHCHVEAGPARTEVMSREVMEACLKIYVENDFDTIDITGGAPEMNPHFEWFVEEASKVCSHVIVRTNLVILKEEAYAHLMEFYKKQKVEIVCSLPYYAAKDANRQRGEHVFEDSVEVLQKLNELGYGKEDELVLNLVYNPGGAFFPPAQAALEKEYKEKLYAQFGIVFHNLFTITNNPIGRFGAFLNRSGNLKGYMKKLYQAFNAGTLEGMMCRNQISVGWDGKVYDCDFNQMEGMEAFGGKTVLELAGTKLKKRKIQFGKHCYACTAGQGSSCGGVTED